MKPPSFWNKDKSLVAILLSPLGWLYHFGVQRRVSKTGIALPVRVISVGNINLGGTGKTPTVIALCEMLRAMNVTPTVVMRGYGGSLSGPVKVDPNHSADDVGDEAVLISAFAPVVVSKDRAAGATLAVDEGAELIILDDALQNPAVQRDLSICVVDAQVGFGNGKVAPAGPLREKPYTGLTRSDLVILVGPEADRNNTLAKWPEIASRPVLGTEIKPLLTGMDWQGTRVLAFAGIGRPEKFFQSLKSVGAEIIATRSFGDHQKIPTAMLARLKREADLQTAQLVTTEKDAARLPKTWQQQVLTFPVRLIFEDANAVDQRLRDLVSGS